jgi:hypothetical protein
MPARLTASLVGVLVAAGAAGAGLAIAGVTSPATAILVLVFLAVAPTAAIAGLLRLPEASARLIIAGTANVALLALTALLMLAWGLWSPRGGLVAVAAITALCFLAQWPPVARRIEARAARWRGALVRRIRAQRPGA